MMDIRDETVQIIHDIEGYISFLLQYLHGLMEVVFLQKLQYDLDHTEYK